MDPHRCLCLGQAHGWHLAAFWTLARGYKASPSLAQPRCLRCCLWPGAAASGPADHPAAASPWTWSPVPPSGRSAGDSGRVVCGAAGGVMDGGPSVAAFFSAVAPPSRLQCFIDGQPEGLAPSLLVLAAFISLLQAAHSASLFGAPASPCSFVSPSLSSILSREEGDWGGRTLLVLMAVIT